MKMYWYWYWYLYAYTFIIDQYMRYILFLFFFCVLRECLKHMTLKFHFNFPLKLICSYSNPANYGKNENSLKIKKKKEKGE